MAVFERYREKFPTAIQEEIVAEGTYFTLARVSVTVDETPGAIVGEGLARRSGQEFPDDSDPILAKNISLGRAHVACAMKLAYHKPWVKLRSLLMA